MPAQPWLHHETLLLVLVLDQIKLQNSTARIFDLTSTFQLGAGAGRGTDLPSQPDDDNLVVWQPLRGKPQPRPVKPAPRPLKPATRPAARRHQAQQEQHTVAEQMKHQEQQALEDYLQLHEAAAASAAAFTPQLPTPEAAAELGMEAQRASWEAAQAANPDFMWRAQGTLQQGAPAMYRCGSGGARRARQGVPGGGGRGCCVSVCTAAGVLSWHVVALWLADGSMSCSLPACRCVLATTMAQCKALGNGCKQGGSCPPRRVLQEVHPGARECGGGHDPRAEAGHGVR